MTFFVTYTWHTSCVIDMNVMYTKHTSGKVQEGKRGKGREGMREGGREGVSEVRF